MAKRTEGLAPAPALQPQLPGGSPRALMQEEPSIWATAKWSAADVQAIQEAQAAKAGAGQGKRPRQSKSARKAEPLPPTVAQVIHQRRARIDQWRTIRGFLFKLAVIAAIGYGLFTWVFGFAAMKGEQMYPRIRDGDLMLYYRLEDTYSIGDVITFIRQGKQYVGRIVARGGDVVDIDQVGQLLVNGNIQTEEIFYPTTVPEGAGIPFPLSIGENSLFLLCDMRTQATDSRAYGPVSMDEVEGKVISIMRRRGI